MMSEFELVKEVIMHPAGFDLAFGGDLISIRTTDQDTVEVEWTTMSDMQQHYRSFSGKQIDEAVEFFVKKRKELRFGMDYEIEGVKQ